MPGANVLNSILTIDAVDYEGCSMRDLTRQIR
jgi:hypothetical protein